MRSIVTPQVWRWQPAFRYNGVMNKSKESPFPFPPKRVYYGAHIPMRVIRRYAHAIAEATRRLLVG